MEQVNVYTGRNNIRLFASTQAGGLSNRKISKEEDFNGYIATKYFGYELKLFEGMWTRSWDLKKGRPAVPIEPITLHPVHQYTVNEAIPYVEAA